MLLPASFPTISSSLQRIDLLRERNAMHDEAQFFVGWGTLSLINAGLAQAKGRSGLLWWLLSLILGPIATFLIVVRPQGGSSPGFSIGGKARTPP